MDPCIYVSGQHPQTCHLDRRRRASAAAQRLLMVLEWRTEPNAAIPSKNGCS